MSAWKHVEERISTDCAGGLAMPALNTPGPCVVSSCVGNQRDIAVMGMLRRL
uniref:Uncharacterized protein n=1 Tax=Anguilla anguilla TaxID=7936 RepID=A0A0E9RU52_ANGAN